METHHHHLQFYGTRRRMSVARVYRRSRAAGSTTHWTRSPDTTSHVCRTSVQAFARIRIHDALDEVSGHDALDEVSGHDVACLSHECAGVRAHQEPRRTGQGLRTRRRMSVARTSVQAFARIRSHDALDRVSGHDVACLSLARVCRRSRASGSTTHWTGSPDTTPHVCQSDSLATHMQYPSGCGACRRR